MAFCYMHVRLLNACVANYAVSTYTKIDPGIQERPKSRNTSLAKTSQDNV